MSGVTFYNNNNNFNMEKSKVNKKLYYMEEPISLSENFVCLNLSNEDFSNLSHKEKALNLYYTQNKSTSNIYNSNTSVNKNKIKKNDIRSQSESYPYTHGSKSSNISSNIDLQQKNILIDLVKSVKLYNDDICLMIKDLFKTNSEGNKTELNYYDVEDFFKYSLVVGQQECSVSEKLINTIRHFSKCLVEQTQEIKRLQKQNTENSLNKYFNSLNKLIENFKENNKELIESRFQVDDFNRECLAHLEEMKEHIDNSEVYYQNLIKDLLNEIRQRDELLDCYQKRENNLFNSYYPKLIRKIESNSLSKYQRKEVVINEMTQQLEELEKAFQDKLIMKNNLIEEINMQKSLMEASYLEKLKAKDEIISNINEQYKEKERELQNEIAQYKKRSAVQVKLAEQIRTQIQNQQIEYCKKMDEMQQNLDSRGKIIAYVKNKLSIRENELKIANIKYTTTERQMNIEKDQYKREIANLKEELEKTNEDIDDLENELDTQEEEHKEELERLEKEHDFQINKLWNIIDQRENAISEMEVQIEELKEKNSNLEQSLLKFENIEKEKEKEKSEEIIGEDVAEEIIVDDMNEKSNITVTGDTSEEIIILNKEYSENSRINDQERAEYYSPNILSPEFTSDECEVDLTEDDKTGLTSTEERCDDEETNSLTLTEDMSGDSEIDERREFIEEEDEEEDNNIENEGKIVHKENEELKLQYEVINQENINLRSELDQERDKLKQESEKYNLQQQQYEEIKMKYTQVCGEKEGLELKCKEFENEIVERVKEQKIQKELNDSLEQRIGNIQKEKDDLDSRVKQLEITIENTISLERYDTLKKELNVALENVNEQRRKKNYLKQKLANQHNKNKILVELIKKERTKNKEEIRKLKQSCVNQNGKIKAILKQVKDGLVTAEHIDLDRIVKRMKSERVIMTNEYERLKKVASAISIKSNSNLRKQSFILRNENLSELKKDLSREGNVEITVQNPNSSKSISNESKILIKVAPNFESLQEESIISKQANDSLNSIESVDENQELEVFSLKKALSQQNCDINYSDEDDDQNSFIDFTIPSSYDNSERRNDEINESSINGKEDISLIFGENANGMTPRQVNLYNRILQIPGVLPFNISDIKNFEYDDTNFSISSDSSMYKEGENYLEKKDIGLDIKPINRVRYKSCPKSYNKNGNNHNTLRRMPNFDQIAKLTKIKIKRSAEEIVS